MSSKFAAVLALAGTYAVIAAAPSQAEWRGPAPARPTGSYSFAPGQDAYAAAPYGYDTAPGPSFDRTFGNRLPAGSSPNDCSTDLGYGRRDYSQC
jgi:hypothetical protein